MHSSDISTWSYESGYLKKFVFFAYMLGGQSTIFKVNHNWGTKNPKKQVPLKIREWCNINSHKVSMCNFLKLRKKLKTKFVCVFALTRSVSLIILGGPKMTQKLILCHFYRQFLNICQNFSKTSLKGFSAAIYFWSKNFGWAAKNFG